MTKRMVLLLIGVAALGLVSCNLFLGAGSSGTVSSSDIAKFQKVFMSSYTAERGGIGGGSRVLTPFSYPATSSARATVPVNQLINNSFLALSPSTFAGYPEPGQSTTFTITPYDVPNNVYDVTVTTTFSPADNRKNYVEEYYVRDIGKNGSGFFDPSTPDGRWTVDDPIVKWTGTWVQDQRARVRQILTFVDGTTRAETIVSQTDYSLGTPAPKFAAFDPAGSLSFGQLFIPAADNNAVFSSVVVYNVTPATNPNFWFWQGSNAQTILGIRYYTEFGTAGTYTTSTISFEKTLSTLSTQAVSSPQVWSTVFVGSQYDTLAESVLRQQVTYSTDTSGTPILGTGTSTTNMQSRVVNISGQKDFYLTQLNSDFVTLSAWDTTTVYTPTGNAAEILAADPSKFLYGRTGTEAGGGPALWLSSTSGLGDLAGLYVSLVTGAASLPVSNPLPADPTHFVGGSATDMQFNGSTVGADLPDTAGVYDLPSNGTIEAWVYIKQQQDTAGIVHKGVNPDFSDESYSLQFWGNQGQIALTLDGAGGGSNYDLLTSTINLNTGTWYYLVATWDRTTSPNTMKLYIDGALNSSRTPTVSGAPQTNGSDLLIGSQLPSIYSVAYGYFTFNGAIYGVKVYPGTPPDATAILGFYNANKGLTASWPHP